VARRLRQIVCAARLEQSGVIGAIAPISAQPRRHQEDGRAHPLAPARLDVPPHFRDQGDAGLDVPDEFLLNGLEIAADGFKNLRQVGGGRRFLRCVAQLGVA
jgi:hypothetical protein